MTTSTYISEQIIDTFFTDSGKYVSEHTANPGATGINEVTTGIDANYVRKAVTFVKSASGTVFRARNNADIVFPAAGAGASYTVTFLCIWSALTGGNLLAVLAIPGSGLPVVAGTINTFAINDIVVLGD